MRLQEACFFQSARVPSPINRLKKINYFIKVFSSCLNELQPLPSKKSYPGLHAVLRNPEIAMGDLQRGHLKAGLGRI